TEKTEGYLIEGGPDCFLSEKPWAMALCRKLGLGDRLMPTARPRGKTFVLSKGKLHLLPEGVILMVPTKMLPLLTSSLISIPGMIRMGLELFIPKKKGNKDESLAEFVTRRLGKEALDKIAEPLVAGVHAGDPDTMSIRSSFPKFVELEEKYGSLIKGMLARMKSGGMHGGAKPAASQAGPRPTMFMTLKGGLVELIDKLVERSKDAVEIRTNTMAADIKENKELGYAITLGDGSSLRADAVIFTTPAHVTANLIGGVDRELPQLLRTIAYVSTATVSIAFEKKDIKHPLDGFGFVIPRTEGRKIMAATWSSVKWEGRAPDDKVLIRCFVGGASNAALVDMTDEEMSAVVRAELKDIMGIDAVPVLTRIYRWKNSMPQYTIGHIERVEEIMKLSSRHKGLYLTGSAYKGIGISDTVREAEETAKAAFGALKNA
ncbi:MAG: protoporphyrinogen oxidase, partial [Deltaproteobacteria bacterium]|nr:protoporphyrinogen oxidase [Deltaproteobacteria bacterium]